MNAKNDKSLLLRDLRRLTEEDFMRTYRSLNQLQRTELSTLLNETDEYRMLNVYGILVSEPEMIEIEVDGSKRQSHSLHRKINHNRRNQ
jgi:hypothetical protein